MLTTADLAAEYRRRAEGSAVETEAAATQSRRISLARLAAGLAEVALAFLVFGSAAISPLWFIGPAIVFFILVYLHARVEARRKRASRAAAFYQRGLSRLENRWMGAGNAGERFRDPKHVYAEDLDLFGAGSLFELLCTARTRAGEDALAGWLLAPASRETALGRQAAITELSGRLDLREEMALLGEDMRGNLHADAIEAWGAGPPVHFPPGLRAIAVALSVGTIASGVLYLGGYGTRIPLLIFVLLLLAMSLVMHSRVQAVLGKVDLPAHDLELLAGAAAVIEREPANAPALREIQQRLETGGTSVATRIGRLETLVTRHDWAHNMFFAPIAAALMWQVHLAIAIERWRRESGMQIRSWIAATGDYEALCALSSYAAEHPYDVLPELTEGPALFEAQGLGHPLLSAGQCVRNDLSLDAATPLAVVSGSNMSGKSTLLRAVGLNAVLAWAGAPVCAVRLVLSPLAVAASIRIVDSLLDGRSRFYAEITRLRQIVDLTGKERAVLFLLDELLSGTNSHDRRIGAAAIAKSLIGRGAIGLLTTHDLALAHIAESIEPAGINVHFEDAMENGTLRFDYRLRPGVVARSNALELMRSVGLEV